MKDKSAVLELKSGAPFEPAKIRTAIDKAGYDSRDFHVTAIGRLERREGRLVFRPDGLNQVFAVRAGPASGDVEAFVGKRARVRGKLVSEEKELDLELLEVGSPGG